MAGYGSVPYTSKIYSSPGHARIADLIRRRGETTADHLLRSGDISAQLWANVGNTVARTMADLVQQRREKPIDDLRKAQAERERQSISDDQQIQEALKLSVNPETGRIDPKIAAREVTAIDPIKGLQWWQAASAEEREELARQHEAAKEVATKGAMLLSAPPPMRPQLYARYRPELIQKYGYEPEAIPEQYDEAFVREQVGKAIELTDAVKAMGQAAADAAKNPEGFTLSPGQTRFGSDGKPLASVPETPKKPEPAKVGSFEDYLTRKFGENPTPAQIESARAAYAAADRAPAGDGAKFWVIRDGKQIRISESEYRPGDLNPSSREQGRPVTSGDAGRIADLDTSLDDLNVLTRDLGITGTASKIGAMMPNFVTDLTGWGADAKSRQAVIDRVKQVIGKALEGGVLRKEDEIKYERILPTIGDTSEVAKSKLRGLWEAIEKRRQTTIDALSDAGYDVSKFTARPPRVREDSLTGKPDLEVGKTPPVFSIQAPDGQTYTFPTQKALDDFKKAAGIGGKPQASVRPGQEVTIDGQRIRISRVYPDGTFDGDPA